VFDEVKSAFGQIPPNDASLVFRDPQLLERSEDRSHNDPGIATASSDFARTWLSSRARA
jgi:hypothetical protein